VKFESFASSSHGNLYTVSDGTTALIIECGIPYKKLNQSLGFELKNYAACLLSHSHG
jgi:hypothetical protein